MNRDNYNYQLHDSQQIYLYFIEDQFFWYFLRSLQEKYRFLSRFRSTDPEIEKSRKRLGGDGEILDESWHRLINNYDAEWRTRER